MDHLEQWTLYLTRTDILLTYIAEPEKSSFSSNFFKSMTTFKNQKQLDHPVDRYFCFKGNIVVLAISKF